jgi:hypothetical protein
MRSDDFLYLGRVNPDKTMDIAGLVPDGITSAAAGSITASVNNNMFVLSGVPTSVDTVSVSNSQGMVRAIKFGRVLPPGVVVAPDPT